MTLPLSSVGQVAHVRRHLGSLRKKLTSRVALLRRLAGSGWGAGAMLWTATLALSTAEYCAPVWCRSAHTCLLTPPSTTPCELWLDACVLHQWTTFQSSQASNLWVSSQRSHTSLRRRAMKPGHLLHSALTRPSGAAARCLKSRHPFVTAAQQLISTSDNNNIRAAQWTDHQWNAEWVDNPTRLRTLIPDSGMHPPPEWPSQEEPGSGLTASSPVSDVSAPACTNGVWPFCGLWGRRRTNRRPCRPSMSNPSTSPRTTRPDGSGWWDNRMAA